MRKSTKLTSALCLSLAISSTATKADTGDFILGLGAGIVGSAIANNANKTQTRTQPRQRTTTRKSRYSSETQDIQMRLNMLGFDAGNPDGVSGRRTRNAIRQFQISIGAYASGKLDNRQIAKLYELTTPQQPATVVTPVITPVVTAAPVATPAPVVTTAPAQQININVPAAAPAPAPVATANIITNTQVLALTANPATKNETKVSPKTTLSVLDPTNLPAVHGLTVERFEHDVKGLLEKVGYQSCNAEETRTTCTLERDTLSETVNVLTQDEKIYGLQREVQFKNPAPRAAIMGKLLDAYPALSHFENMTASGDKTCRITYLNNSGELLKAAIATPANAEALRQLADNCSDYHSLEVFGDDTVSGLRMVFYSSKPIRQAIENRKGVFQISSKPAQELTF